MKFRLSQHQFAARSLAWLFCVMVFCSMAQAQDAAPEPNLTRSPSPLIGFGLIFLFTVVIVAVSLMPSKRGHQD